MLNTIRHTKVLSKRRRFIGTMPVPGPDDDRSNGNFWQRAKRSSKVAAAVPGCFRHETTLCRSCLRRLRGVPGGSRSAFAIADCETVPASAAAPHRPGETTGETFAEPL